ncbi:type II toxin-antitoxin system VapB family antitoxin [Mangrovicella endophytica]|uniref:type II toxin-antitoxin system VapB family antitoxin n=1 Tax=Mangrovicella endophytica TaxID=2066697 RepID=UPI000C9DB64D|nr:type II toxin-antitoxin system VapB family antitoxin [Mangrovicella endophytica]
MAFHIKNPETDALARELAAKRKTGLTEAVHAALQAELDREREKPLLPDLVAAFCRDLRKKAQARAEAGSSTRPR